MARSNALIGHTKSPLNIGKAETPTRGNYLDKVQRAYMAGIMDGEGHITVYKSSAPNCRTGYRYRVAVAMVNNSLKLVMLMKNWYGGTVYTLKPREFTNNKTSYRWGLNSVSECHNFLTQIEPYLVVKREQAKLCLEFLNNGGMGYNGGIVSDAEWLRRKRLHERSLRLNHRGAEPQRLSEESEPTQLASDSPVLSE